MKIASLDEKQMDYLNLLASEVQGRFDDITHDEALIVGSNLMVSRNAYLLNRGIENLKEIVSDLSVSER